MTKYLVVLILILIVMVVVVYFFPKPKFTMLSLDSLPQKTGEHQISVLTANVGNSNFQCKKFLWKLCIPEVEQNISQNIQSLQPDIVVLQEVFSRKLCQKNNNVENSEFCVYDQEMSDPQAVRLLGENYTIVCDANNHMQCIGIKKDFAQVKDCSGEGLCLNGRTIQMLESCDSGFTIFAVSVETNQGLQFDVVNVHLNSMDKACRKRMLAELTGNQNNILQNSNVLLMGDFNIDLYQGNEMNVNRMLDLFSESFQSPFKIHEALNSDKKPHVTFQFGPFTRTLDYGFSNFLSGDLVALGRTKNTTRLDGGWGMDHTALYGIFEPE